MQISVPVYLATVDGAPEVAGRLDIDQAVSEMLADGILRIEPMYRQVTPQGRRLMEIRLTIIANAEDNTATRVV